MSERLQLGLAIVAMFVAIVAMVISLAPIGSTDHRQVMRVCRNGTLIVRDGVAWEVVRPGRNAGWDVAPGSTLDSLCPGAA